jgi:hypothetical protein
MQKFFELQPCINTPEMSSCLSPAAYLFCAAGSDVFMCELSPVVQQNLFAIVLSTFFSVTVTSYVLSDILRQN